MAFNFTYVIGLVGPKAAGKTTASDYLVDHYSFHPYLLSTSIRAEGQKRGHDPVPVSVLQDIGDQWRRQSGPGVLAIKTLSLARRRKHKKIIIDGIRNPGEIRQLQARVPPENLLLIGIKAPVWSRYHRVKDRDRAGDQLDYQEFLATHRRDMGQNQPPDGQQVAKCLKLVPKQNILDNDNGIRKFTRQLDDLYLTRSTYL